MSRMSLHLALISVFATVGSFASAQTPEAVDGGRPGGRRAVPSAKFLKQLNKPKDFKGIPKTPLVDALEYLSDLYDLTIIVDDRALNDAGVDWQKTTLTGPLAAMRKATARQALDAILSKATTPRGARILLFYRHDYVEITTVQGLLKELPQQWRDLKYWAGQVAWSTVGTYQALLHSPQEEVLDLLLDLVPLDELADLLAQAGLIKYTLDCVLERDSQ
ncbi:MAG TPA: hypothetical protein VKI65_00925 [Gemmataceae bacterium]|nr:hypothetical protein [Gemmataceae bacterium]